MLKQLTETIFSCHSIECLQEIEDFVLANLSDLTSPELTCVYTMLHVRNKILYDDKVVRKMIYTDE